MKIDEYYLLRAVSGHLIIGKKEDYPVTIMTQGAKRAPKIVEIMLSSKL